MTINVSGSGTLVSEPELREVGNGKAVLSLRVAAYQGKDKEKVFIDLEMWDEPGVNANKSFSKGDNIIFTGELKEDTWKNKEGENRRKMKINLREVGPSLRFATSVTTKVEFKGGSDTSTGRGRDNVDTAEAKAMIQEQFAQEEPF